VGSLPFIPPDLAKRLHAFVPPPPEATLAAEDDLPEAVDLQQRGYVPKGREPTFDRVALVRRDNSAMRKLCQLHGFQRAADSHALYLRDAQPAAAWPRQHASHLLPVDTLGYAGIWIEGHLSQAAVDAAARLASIGGASLVGAVIPGVDVESAALLAANSFRIVGQYHWWTINLRND